MSSEPISRKAALTGVSVCFLAVSLVFSGCRYKLPAHDRVRNLGELDEHVQHDIQQAARFLSENDGRLDDSTALYYPVAVVEFYGGGNYRPRWSSAGTAAAAADSLMEIIAHAHDYGLSPAAYHLGALQAVLQEVKTDSRSRRDAMRWTYADILLSDAFMKLAGDLRYGRLPEDSITLRRDSVFSDSTLIKLLQAALPGKVSETLSSVEPPYPPYRLLQQGLARFNKLRAGSLPETSYRYWQLALNLDRWRQFPDPAPREYLLVNIPSCSMQLWRDDTVRLASKVIAGAPSTPTPLLNSSLVNFQLYPYWRVPFSIAVNEMLPAIKKDTGYLTAHNLEIIDKDNNPVDPATVNWDKLGKHHFPYLIRQMTGLDNSLGIIKFNFRNKYSVYLHDTNIRGLFARSDRALSHGCVRVQQWDSLAMYLIRTDTARHLRDSVLAWITDEQQKQVTLKHGVPLYIRYFTCSADSSGALTFYKDIYGYDSIAVRRLYARRQIRTTGSD